jgi:hypothetical protein
LIACNENDQATPKQNIPSEEILVTANMESQIVSVVATGNPWQNDCELNLLAKGPEGKSGISLKENNVLCSLFGPVKLITAKRGDLKANIVIVQAARGGDGDHTGPILDIYSFRNNKFKKLGEQELFDANYQIRSGAISSISGNVLFSFCDVCDGPGARDDEDNVFVSAIITFGCGGICVKPNISNSGRTDLIARFQSTKTQKLKEEDHAQDYLAFVNNLEQRFTEFIHRK